VFVGYLPKLGASQRRNVLEESALHIFPIVA
jgi:hypothetical protein